MSSVISPVVSPPPVAPPPAPPAPPPAPPPPELSPPVLPPGVSKPPGSETCFILPTVTLDELVVIQSLSRLVFVVALPFNELTDADACCST